MTGLAAEPPLPRAARARVALPFLVVTLIWGTTWLVIRDQIGTVPAAWSIAYRFLVAGAGMFAWAALSGGPLRLPIRAAPFVLIVGLTQFVGNFNFVYRAEAHVTSGLVAVIFSLLIVPNAILSRIFLGQAVSRPFVAGSAVALAGVALLFHHELGASGARAGDVAFGIGLTLAGVLCASIANVLQAGERAKRLPMAAMLGWAMLAGAGMNAALAWGTVGPPSVDWRWSYLGGIVYLGLFASAIAFTFYFGLIRAIGPSRAAYINVLTPVIAMILSTLFEAYRWTPEALAGATLTIAGLAVALRARRPAR